MKTYAFEKKAYMFYSPGLGMEATTEFSHAKRRTELRVKPSLDRPTQGTAGRDAAKRRQNIQYEEGALARYVDTPPG